MLLSAHTTTDHEYENTGNYDAVVSYTLKKGGGTCSSNSTKHIVINWANASWLSLLVSFLK